MMVVEEDGRECVTAPNSGSDSSFLSVVFVDSTETESE